MAADSHLGYTKIAITSQPVLPIDVIFGYRVGLVRESRNFSEHPYIGRIAQSSLR